MHVCSLSIIYSINQYRLDELYKCPYFVSLSVLEMRCIEKSNKSILLILCKCILSTHFKVNAARLTDFIIALVPDSFQVCHSCFIVLLCAKHNLCFIDIAANLLAIGLPYNQQGDRVTIENGVKRWSMTVCHVL